MSLKRKFAVVNALLDEQEEDDMRKLTAIAVMNQTITSNHAAPLVALTALTMYRECHEKVENYIQLLCCKSDYEFFRFTRVTKPTFYLLVHMLQDTPAFNRARALSSNGPTPTSATVGLAATLWYLGNMCSQRDIAERFRISQGHLCHLIKTVVGILCQNSNKFIVWPTAEKVAETEEGFLDLAGFPGIIGAIDGCHVPVLAPDIVQADYLDRNHNHSVNLMAVCDDKKKFTYCFAGYPGSVHDQRVFANSALGHAVSGTENSTFFPSNHYHIVGDSAFMLRVNVMVPFKDTGSLTISQINYNKKLSQSRRVIENTFALLKGRFRRLRRLESKLDNVPQIIIACCVLHNVTVDKPNEVELLLQDSEECINVIEPSIQTTTSCESAAARKKRDAIAARLQK